MRNVARKSILVTVTIALGILLAGTAAGATTPHVTGATATCTSQALQVVFGLRDVPAGTPYLAVVNGVAQKSQTGTTHGTELTVTIPVDCAAVAGRTVDVDVSLTSPDLAEDTPFLGVPIRQPHPTTTTTVRVAPPLFMPVPAIAATSQHVAAPAPARTLPRPVPTLPRTGSATVPAAAIGTVLLLAGLALVYGTRRTTVR